MWVHDLGVGSKHGEDLGREIDHPHEAIGRVLGHSASNERGTSFHVGVGSSRPRILHPHHLPMVWVKGAGGVAGWSDVALAWLGLALVTLLELWLASVG